VKTPRGQRAQRGTPRLRSRHTGMAASRIRFTGTGWSAENLLRDADRFRP